MRAIVVKKFGGPEVLQLEHDAPEPPPVAGHVRIEVSAAGVNYADTHKIENGYIEAQSLPFTPGSEVVGRTPDGTRVLAMMGDGGYAEFASAPTSGTVPIPDNVTDAQALALGLQGLTASLLLSESARLTPGESVVVHAAAGGVGSLAVQLARIRGAGRVIAVASTPDKRELALDLGAHVAVDSNAEDLAAALREANGGKRVDVVLEMVGGETFDASLRALARFGRLVTYGQASRKDPEPIHPASLMTGSLAISGFWLTDYFARPALIKATLDELLNLVLDGKLRPQVGGAYRLADAKLAYEELTSRRSSGKLILEV